MKKISIANGNYTDKEGNQKTNWVKVGVIGMSQNGKEYVMLDPTINLAAFPREEGRDMVMCTVYDDSQQQSQQNNQQQQRQVPQQQQQHNNYNQQQQNYSNPNPNYQG